MTDGEENGRITQARLVWTLDQNTQALQRVNSQLDDIEKCQREQGVIQATQGVKIEHLQGQVKSWNILNSLGVAGAAILAALGLRQ